MNEIKFEFNEPLTDEEWTKILNSKVKIEMVEVEIPEGYMALKGCTITEQWSGTPQELFQKILNEEKNKNEENKDLHKMQ